jgi:hypothetical protein
MVSKRRTMKKNKEAQRQRSKNKEAQRQRSVGMRLADVDATTTAIGYAVSPKAILGQPRPCETAISGAYRQS